MLQKMLQHRCASSRHSACDGEQDGSRGKPHCGLLPGDDTGDSLHIATSKHCSESPKVNRRISWPTSCRLVRSVRAVASGPTLAACRRKGIFLHAVSNAKSTRLARCTALHILLHRTVCMYARLAARGRRTFGRARHGRRGPSEFDLVERGKPQIDFRWTGIIPSEVPRNAGERMALRISRLVDSVYEILPVPPVVQFYLGFC